MLHLLTLKSKNRDRQEEIMNREYIQMRVSLVVRVIDDFTGMTLDGNDVKVTVQGAKPPVRKADGYFVFLNLINPVCRIIVESYQYQNAEIEVDLKQIHGEYPLVKIRLKPDWVYRLPIGSTSLSGYGKPNQEFFVIPDENDDFYKLLFAYPNKKEEYKIAIYNPENRDLEGQLFEIMEKEGKQKEQFFVLKQSEDGKEYLLKQPLKQAYKKVGTRICRIYSCKTREDGRYFLPLWIAGKGKVTCRVYYKEENDRFIELEIGKKNQIDLL